MHNIFLASANWDSFLDSLLAPAQIIGYVAFVIAVVSFQQKKRKNIVLWQFGCNVLFAIHWIFLGGTVGFMLNIISAVRSFVFYFREEKKWARSNVWIAVFSVLSIAAGMYGIMALKDNLWALFPVFAMIISTVSFSLRNPFHVRTISAVASPCWLAYNISSGSVAGIVTELTVLTSIVIAIFRIDLKGKIFGKRKNQFSADSDKKD